ncbi:MAG: hypothetical protein ABIR16_02345 [Dokdonella sp.]
MTDHDPALVASLDRLDTHMQKMLDGEVVEAYFWPEFNAEAEAIRGKLRGDDLAYAKGRIDCMLKNAGMIPGEDEGEPCER